MKEKGLFELKPWLSHRGDYREMNGLMLLVTGEAGWYLEDGGFSYIQVELIEIGYNVASVY